MPAVARGAAKDAVSTNHGCQGMTRTAGLSNNVFVNNNSGGAGIHRKTDANVVHSFPVPGGCAPHSTVISSGSGTVFANNLGVADVGDAYTGGETVATGSPNVFTHGS
jgi:uncharacterized Zn-binding protein involved in type VI secretion